MKSNVNDSGSEEDNDDKPALLDAIDGEEDYVNNSIPQKLR